MSSQKWSAAEKYFIKKETEYLKQIKLLKTTVDAQNKSITELSNKNQQLIDENTKLKDWVKRLLDYTKLSEDDIKEACKKDKSLVQFSEFFNMISKYF